MIFLEGSLDGLGIEKKLEKKWI